MLSFLLIILLTTSVSLIVVYSWNPLPVKEDVNLFQPGTQPGEAGVFTSPDYCSACHGGYDKDVEPAANWKGSMMAQAARDPLWLTAVTVSLQDSIYTTGNPNAGDICVKCHSPSGWLEERSDPVNMEQLTGMDYEGVHCDFCHRLVDPIGASTERDQEILGNHTLFDGSPYLTDGVPTNYGTGELPDYIENGGGQFFVDPESIPRGPRGSTLAAHDTITSIYHSEDICGVCHDVSNPVLASLLIAPDAPETQAASSYYHVERTYSEFILSTFAEGAETSIPGVEIASSCQDCHMPGVEGKSSILGTPIYEELALHSFAGGNTWISGILASADPGYEGYDEYNHEILSGEKYSGASIQISGLENRGESITAVSEKATELLQNAATIEVVESSKDEIVLIIHNNAGHKLTSGFPEGRRMFLNVKYIDEDGALLDEVNPYSPLETRLESGNEVYLSGGKLDTTHDELVWEVKMSSIELTGEETTFHMALSTDRYKDNRIPPRGFDTDGMYVRLVQPRWVGEDAPGYFTEEEYAGGFDKITLTPPVDTIDTQITLYYQTTSKEFIEFLRDEVNGDNPTLPQEAYVAQTDPFFQDLKGWGDAIWDLWLHNDGAKPVEMTTSRVQFDVAAPEPEQEPEPQPESEPEPEPEPETGGDGIPGYPIEAIFLGLILFALFGLIPHFKGE